MFRALRNLYMEFTSFGKPELEKIRNETIRLQEQLLELKAARAERERQVEVLAIARLRATVEQMRQMDSVTKAAEAHVKDLVEDLGESARPRMQAAIAAEVQEKAQAAMKQLDLDELLSEPSSSSPPQPNSGDTRGQHAEASGPAAQSPAADPLQGSRDAQPVRDAVQSNSSSGHDSCIGGNNDIVSRLKSRTEGRRGSPA